MTHGGHAPGVRTVFLVDDHPLVRDGLTLLIEQEGDLKVCGWAESVAGAFDAISKLRPDAIVLDLSLKGESGLHLIKQVQESDWRPPILVLSMHDEEFYAERALRAGALGYVMKQDTSGNVVKALRRVLAGELYVSANLASKAAERFLTSGLASNRSPLHGLTDRELEIFRRIGQGLENRRIAEDLNLSLKTVQTHCAHIKDKLGLPTAAALMREAVRFVESER